MSLAYEWPEPTLLDTLEFMGSTPLGPYVDCAPLWTFSVDRRRQIHAAVLASRPPEKWLILADGLAMIESRAWYEWHWYRGIDPEARRPSLPQWKRLAVIRRDGLLCGLCGGDVEPDEVHIDHIHPWSLGGSDALSNLQVTHSVCNLRKGNRI